jgi:hypothetical protein
MQLHPRHEAKKCEVNSIKMTETVKLQKQKLITLYSWDCESKTKFCQINQRPFSSNAVVKGRENPLPIALSRCTQTSAQRQ